MWFQQDPASSKILAEIKALTKQVAGLRGERDAAKEELGLSTRIVSLEHGHVNSRARAHLRDPGAHEPPADDADSHRRHATDWRR